VIQDLMWLNLERLQRDYEGFEDGRSKHFRKTGNTAIIKRGSIANTRHPNKQRKIL
jgi:hypothetical protein